jgi:hypothetical protein
MHACHIAAAADVRYMPGCNTNVCIIAGPHAPCDTAHARQQATNKELSSGSRLQAHALHLEIEAVGWDLELSFQHGCYGC